MFFFFQKPQIYNQFLILLPKHISFFALFFHFYEVFLNMGLSGCQTSNFHGEDLMFIFQNLNFTLSFSYFFSPGPPWDPRGDPTCDKISSICKIWQVFVFSCFSRPGAFFSCFFSTPGCFFSCLFATGCFFHVVFRPVVFSHVFYSNHIIKSYYKIML